MGLGVGLVWPLACEELSQEVLTLLLLGGAVYITGIVFFVLGEFKPIYHTVWHLFVVLAAALHWFDVYFFVVRVSLDSPTKTVVTDLVGSVTDAAVSVTSLAVNAAAAAVGGLPGN